METSLLFTKSKRTPMMMFGWQKARVSWSVRNVIKTISKSPKNTRRYVWPYSSHILLNCLIDEQYSSDRSQKSTCNEHHALNDAHRVNAGCDVTGIGVTACWHGFFCPAAVVNFQKGERSVLQRKGINFK